jgi:hypothetical protein
MRSLATLVGASALALSLSACGGGLSHALCTTIGLRDVGVPELIYPVPGYGKVPDNAPAMVVALTGAPQLMQTITITPNGGGAISLGPPGAAPKVMPTPYVTNPINGGTLYGVTMPKLQAKTYYAVNYRYANTVGLCGTSSTSNVSMGNFTTL